MNFVYIKWYNFMQNMHASLNTDIDIYILAPNDTPQMGDTAKRV